MSKHQFDAKDEALHKWLDAEPAPKTGADLGFPPGHLFHDAEVVSTYTADEAVEDGFLVDVTQDARRCGIKLKRALVSKGVWHDCIVPRSPVTGKDTRGENVINPEKALNHLFFNLSVAVHKGPRDETMWWFEYEKRQIKAVFAGAVLTLCFPEED